MKTANYRVWHIINLDNEGIGKRSFHFPVISPIEGANLISLMSTFELSFPESVIGSNVFGLEYLVDGDWEEWSSEDFEDIDELIESMDDTEST